MKLYTVDLKILLFDREKNFIKEHLHIKKDIYVFLKTWYIYNSL